MVGDRIIAYTGKLLVHAVRALLVCWQRMLRLGLSVGVLSGIVALVFGTYVTHTFPPAPLTWVAALFFGLALGYAAAMTVLADEMLLSIFEAIRLLEGDVRAGMRAAAVAAEREAGEAGRGIMRFLGHSRSESAETAPRSGKAPLSQPLMTVSSVARQEPGQGQDQANETLAAIAATESFITTAPRPAVNARPVRAADLPRIGWASDDAAMQRAPEAVVAVAPAPALAEMPPLPVRTLRGQPRAAVAATNDTSATLPADVYPGTVGRVAMWDDAETQPAAEKDVRDGQAEAPAMPTASSPAVDDTSMGVAVEENASGGAPANAETEETAASGDAATVTDRPPAATTRPIEPDREERGIWARIGQALIGNTTVPLRETDTVANPSSEPSETGAP